MSEDKDSCHSTKLLKLKGFKIQHKIGSGSYATVYKAHTDNKEYTDVAIKCIDKTKMSSKMFDGIVNEIKVLKLLHHEHIVSMLDFLWDERYVYIVLEYCEGGDLSSFIRSHETLSEFQVQQFVRQLVLALQFLHQHNVCHLDLKPQNVLIKKSRLKLADFGFAQFLAPEDQTGGATRGSPLYMAPEVLAGAAFDSRADLWSLGVLSFEALFGHAPHASCSLGQLRAHAESSAPVPIPPNSLSLECVDFLARLLVKDPTRRLTHAQLFAHPFPDLTHTPGPASLQQAAELGRRAVELDAAAQFSEAFTLYCETINYMLPLAYEEADTVKKRALQEKIGEYKKRAEELRSVLVREHRPRKDTKAEACASPSTLTSLRAVAASRPGLSAGLEIGEAGEMYLAEGSYEAALEKLKSALSVLMPLCEAEPPSSPLKPLLALQIKDWLGMAEHLQTIVEANRLQLQDLNATAAASKCSLQ